MLDEQDRPPANRRGDGFRRLVQVAAVVAAGALLPSPASAGVSAPPAVKIQTGAATTHPGPVRAAVGSALRLDDVEGGTRIMRAELEEATKGYLDAQATLVDSGRRQAELAARRARLESELARGTEALGAMAATAYRNGRITAMAALLSTDSADAFIDRAAVLRSIAGDQDRQLKAVVTSRAAVVRASAAIAVEVREQRHQLGLMAARKRQAEQTLAQYGGRASNGFRGTRPLLARAAPRTASGRLTRQACTVNDPTTAGCITPRTLHALRQTRAAGFPRFVSCFRGDNGPGEHPKGRACDYAVHKGGGFGGAATGGNRAYGDDLAAYLVRNAHRLGVLYVIWYHQIWFPGGGWRHYTLGRGDPNTNHTNHVHLSLY